MIRTAHQFCCRWTSKSALRMGALVLVALSAGQGMSASCLAQPSYGIRAVGLFGSEHTSLSGRRFNNLYSFSNRDELVGRSQRFDGDSAHGWTVWYHRNNSTRILGFVDAEHTQSDGYKFSAALGLVRTGYIYGESMRFIGDKAAGKSIWVLEGNRISKAGFVDSNHTSLTGIRNSRVYGHDNYGRLYGTSQNFFSPTQSGQSVWKFIDGVTENIGLVEADHIRNDGFRNSQILRLEKSSGVLVGESQRFNGNSDAGKNLWVYDGVGTRVIGLTDGQHTSSSNRQSAELRSLANGRVLGVSQRFNGANSSGQSAWWYQDGATRQIGLTDAMHTGSNGYQWNDVLGFVNSSSTAAYGIAHQVLGNSTEYGQHAWISNGDTNSIISLTDAEHTRNDGFQYSTAAKLERTVYGYSHRYLGGNTQLGQSAWVLEAGNTFVVGLKDAAHTKSDGYQRSDVRFATRTGFVVGESERFGGTSNDLGVSTWLFKNGVTNNIGLTGAEYTSANGTMRSIADHVTDQGRVVGRAARYLGSSESKGQAIWYHDGNSTRKIGLVGAAHTHADGTQWNEIGDRHGDFSPISRNGMIRGQATRYAGAGGQSTWLFNGLDTIELGLMDSRHTRGDDYRFSEFTSDQGLLNPFNDLGQVIGYSERFGAGNSSKGQTAWMYDPTLNSTTSFELSQRSDGFALSTIEYFDKDGLILGWFEKFGTNDEALGRQAFLYSQADGLNVLGDLVAGGLSSSGWQSLASTVQVFGLDRIVGYGLMQDMTDGRVIFVLDQQSSRIAIPEPTTLPWLIIAAACGLTYRRRSAGLNG